MINQLSYSAVLFCPQAFAPKPIVERTHQCTDREERAKLGKGLVLGRCYGMNSAIDRVNIEGEESIPQDVVVHMMRRTVRPGTLNLKGLRSQNRPLFVVSVN
jgi:hypothetical protein